MWIITSPPTIVIGEDALSYLEELEGERAFLVTDANLHQLGFTERVAAPLRQAGMQIQVFAEVEPEPSVQTVRRGVALMQDFRPDWIVAIGGGSCMDAAKAMWALYERPDLSPEEISPVYRLGVRKARLVAVPTTSGTGSEATWITVLTDTENHRKLGLGNRELVPTVAVVDPEMTRDLPPRITADTGLDVLTHAVEGYVANFHNDFSDPLCLKATELVFTYLPRAVEQGGQDMEAREKMANAATIAGLAFSNSWVGLAHALGHSFGGYFRVPHGRAVALFLPYAMEFNANGGVARYAEMARYLGLADRNTPADQATRDLVQAVRDLERRVGQPTSIQALGIDREALEEALATLCENALTDNSILGTPRTPEWEELEKLFRYAFEGRPVDF